MESPLGRGHVAGCPMAGRGPRGRDLSQAAGFLGPASPAQHRTAGWKRQPGGMWAGSGGSPSKLMGPAATDLRGYGEQGFRVGVQGFGEHRLRRSKLDDLAQVHDRDPVGERPGEARSWVMRTRVIHLVLEPDEGSRTSPRTEASSMETGSSATRTLGSSAIAAAMTTRWRCPPDSSCG